MTTTTNPHPVDSATRSCCGGIGDHAPNCDESRDYTGHHAEWCTNHDDESPLHSDDEPYCSNQVTGISLIPEGDAVKCQAWVCATTAFTDGRFTSAEYAERSQRYDGVEIVLETWRGPGSKWGDQSIRINSDVARSLAAALIRAADIEQGLTRELVKR